ncbi:MAG: glycosyltransferase family 4 protein [Anaerolineales bacterium]|nr:glycosyltransferase family 4 protein [Anaerolineales bacterium]
MNILLLTQVLPYPLDSGPKVKTYHVLRYLAERYEVTLLSFVRGESSEAVEHLRRYCKAVYTVPMDRGMGRDLSALLKSQLTGVPFLMVRDQRKAMLQTLERITAGQKFAVIHADQLNMAQYAARVRGGKKILDSHNTLWLLYQRLCRSSRISAKRLVMSREWKLLKAYERKVGERFDLILAVSEEDRQALIEIGIPKDKIHVIPISIDTRQTCLIKRDNDALNILHLGTMFWPPNSEGVVWFLKEIWPRIRLENPGVKFDIVGAHPPRALRQLAMRDSNVNLPGYVPDPTAYLRRAGVMVVPLRAAGGMRVKILHALAQGIPVVSTTIGCEGIRAENGKHLLIADSAEDFAHATNRLLLNKGEAEMLARNGRALVEEVYDYRRTLDQLGNVYSALAPNGREWT